MFHTAEIYHKKGNKRSRSDLPSHGSANSPSGLPQGLACYVWVCYLIFKAGTVNNTPFDLLCGQKGETVLQRRANEKVMFAREGKENTSPSSAQATKPSPVVSLNKSYTTKAFGPRTCKILLPFLSFWFI